MDRSSKQYLCLPCILLFIYTSMRGACCLRILFECDFENYSTCGFVNDANNDFNWTFTFSPNATRIFSSIGGSDYMYVSGSGRHRRQRAAIVSPTFVHTGFVCVHFMARLHVEQWSSTSLRIELRSQNTRHRYAPYSYERWQLSQDVFALAQISANISVAFIATIGVDDTDTMAIDNVRLISGSCPEVWSAWGSWTECSETCGEGHVTRSRHCPRDRRRVLCDGPSRQRQVCVIQPNCPTGVWGVWSSWSDCSDGCGRGIKSHSRVCDVSPCFGDRTATVNCTITLDCPGFGWREWSAWTVCDQGCGLGSKHRRRSCRGIRTRRRCVGLRQDSAACTELTDCRANWESWLSWEDCDSRCGYGLKTRYRNCRQQHLSLTCRGNNSEHATCLETSACVANWGAWGAWGRCSSGCGVGFKHRERVCLTPFVSVRCTGHSRQPTVCTPEVDCPGCPDNCGRCQINSTTCDPGFCLDGFLYDNFTGFCAQGISPRWQLNRIWHYVIALTGSSAIVILTITLCLKMRRVPDITPSASTTSAGVRQMTSPATFDRETDVSSQMSYAVLSGSVHRMSMKELSEIS